MFSRYRLIPNLDGVFQYVRHLKSKKDIDGPLIEMGKVLDPGSIAMLRNEQFSLGMRLEDFNRKQLANNINARMAAVIMDDQVCFSEREDAKGQYVVSSLMHLKESDRAYFDMLIRYCKLNSNLSSQSKPARLMSLISKYYGMDESLIYLQPIQNREDDIDLRMAQKQVAKVFLNTLKYQTPQWIKDNIDFIYEVVSCNEDRFKEVFMLSEIYPNRLYTLCKQANIKKAGELDGYIELYNKVTGTLIEGEISDERFIEFLMENDEITDKTLSEAIQNVFFKSQVVNINDYKHKDEILLLISKLNDPLYQKLFDRLDEKKAAIMLEVVLNKNTKDHIFSIVTLKEEQLKKLGELVKQANFEAILSKAEDEFRLEQERQSDFQYKYEIGTFFEHSIRERMDVLLAAEITVENDDQISATDVQSGQDIIIYFRDVPLYFLEIKSRWDPRNSVSMSKLQLQKAAENPDKYALIAVDITKYTG